MTDNDWGMILGVCVIWTCGLVFVLGYSRGRAEGAAGNAAKMFFVYGDHHLVCPCIAVSAPVEQCSCGYNGARKVVSDILGRYGK